MEKVINHGIPHVGELIFESINTQGLIQCSSVSETWKVLAENVLLKRWKGKLFQACASGRTEIVKILLENCVGHINFDAKNTDGCTVFMASCKYGHKDVVQLLLDHSDANIDLNAVDNNGLTAFIWACKNGYKDIAQLLLNHPKFNGSEDSRKIAFVWACINRHTDVVQLLLDHISIDITMKMLPNNYWNVQTGEFTLTIGCNIGHKDIVKSLLQCSKVVKL